MKNDKSKKNRKKAQRKELARLISKVLKHPLLPVHVYNELAQAVVNTTRADHDTPEAVLMYLQGHRHEEKRDLKRAKHVEDFTQSEVSKSCH